MNFLNFKNKKSEFFKIKINNRRQKFLIYNKK